MSLSYFVCLNFFAGRQSWLYSNHERCWFCEDYEWTDEATNGETVVPYVLLSLSYIVGVFPGYVILRSSRFAAKVVGSERERERERKRVNYSFPSPPILLLLQPHSYSLGRLFGSPQSSSKFESKMVLIGWLARYGCIAGYSTSHFAL